MASRYSDSGPPGHDVDCVHGAGEAERERQRWLEVRRVLDTARSDWVPALLKAAEMLDEPFGYFTPPQADTQEAAGRLTALVRQLAGAVDGVLSDHPRQPELTLFFPSTLDFKNKTLVEALLSTFLAHEAPACQNVYEPTEGGGALVRLSGLPVEQLAQVADRLADFFDRHARAEIARAVEGAVQPAVDRAIERNLPAVIARAVAPMAILQAQLGEEIIKHIDSIYAEVERTEIKLSDDVVAALRGLEMEVIESKLDRSQWAWDAAAEKLVRKGGWAVGTGAAGSGLVEFLMWLATLGG